MDDSEDRILPNLNKPLSYMLCVRCRERPPESTRCMCHDCKRDWEATLMTLCASCNKIPPTRDHEICPGCYETWSNAVTEKDWTVPRAELNGLPLQYGLCPRCRQESVSDPFSICNKCLEEYSNNRERLCASCGRRRPYPHRKICAFCIKKLMQAEGMGRGDKGIDEAVRKLKKLKGEEKEGTSRPMKVCPAGPKCTDFDERHLSCFYHGAKTTRHVCPQDKPGTCMDSTPEHKREYEHPRIHLGAIPLTRCNIRNPAQPLLTMMGAGVETMQAYYQTDLIANAFRLGNATYAYVQKENGGKSFDLERLHEIQDWFMKHLCVIYCSKEDLLLAIKMGGFRSTMGIKAFWDSLDEICKAVEEDPHVLSVVPFRAGNVEWDSFGRYIKLFAKRAQKECAEKCLAKDRKAAELLEDTPKLTEDDKRDLIIAEADMKAHLGGRLDEVNASIKELVEQAAAKLLESTKDVKTSDSQCLKYSVSCSMGPRPRCTEECAIVLRESVLAHPDFFMHPVSAYLYQDGAYHRKDPAMNRTPYLGESKRWDEASPVNEALVDYNNEKLSPAVVQWSEAMAYEWISRVHATKGTPIGRITLREIKELWNESDDLCLSQAHLPQTVDRHFWDHVVLTKDAAKYIRGNGENAGQRFLDMAKDQKYRSAHVILGRNDPLLVGGEVTSFMEKGGPSAYHPLGFTFGMNNDNYFDEVPIPFTLYRQMKGRPVPPKLPALYIYFTALSEGAFDMIFSNIRDYYSESERRITQTIRFLTKQRLIQSICACPVIDEKQCDKSVRQEKKEETSFAVGIDSEHLGGIHYCVCVDYQNKKIIVSLSGSFYVYERTRVTFDMAPYLGKGQFLSFISFSNAQRDIKTTIWNLRCWPNRLAEVDDFSH